MKTLFQYCPRCSSSLTQSNVGGRRRLSCNHCGWVNYENPLPSVAALVKNRRNELLLVKRRVPPGQGRWALPSGFIEVEESPEKACLRELKEETNLEGKITRLLGVYTQPSRTYRRVLIIAYEVKARGTPLAASDSEEVRFFPLQKLPRIAFASHRRIVDDAMKRRLRKSSGGTSGLRTL
ncbi:hypothetical protein AMJ40_00360 [candidate division TA06 bacterium DG_26]|uniref:Nudix hydrolase domain-containing protein n=1 Tax=candidate division TA06 bacterium DG_26 TaxID=1703771 RepID=A0A0S7WM90_UNCT6|nr:MAG: hypothetical protein AMJ40_00360 [candidate division TA06 bacterium DG_26]